MDFKGFSIVPGLESSPEEDDIYIFVAQDTFTNRQIKKDNNKRICFISQNPVIKRIENHYLTTTSKSSRSPFALTEKTTASPFDLALNLPFDSTLRTLLLKVHSLLTYFASAS